MQHNDNIWYLPAWNRMTHAAQAGLPASNSKTAGGGAKQADLRCHTILLHQGLLCEVDLQRVICAEAHIHPSGKEGGEWIAVVVQEQTVVGQRAHAQAYLCSHSR